MQASQQAFVMQRSQQSFAQVHELGLQFVSIAGQLQMTMLVGIVSFWSEMFTGQQSPIAKRIVERIWTSPDGEHQVLKLALG